MLGNADDNLAEASVNIGTKENSIKVYDDLEKGKSDAYPRWLNILIGTGEIATGGVVCAGSVILAAGIDVYSAGAASTITGYGVLASWGTGSTAIAFGITRMSGANNRKISEEIKDVFLPLSASIVEGTNK